MKKILLITLTLITFALSSFASDENNDKPRVLIIGDSISIGYTPFVIEELKDVANVERINGNCQATVNGLSDYKGKVKVRGYLGDKKWEVIHFNYGLHDLCYRNPKAKDKAKRDKLYGTITTTPEQYEENLQKIVDILKESNAKLIFATTTYVPEGEIGRFAEDIFKFNDAALRVMKKNNITVNPLYELSLDVHKKHGKGDTKYGSKDGNVHYEAEGSKILSKQVCEYIRNALPATEKK